MTTWLQIEQAVANQIQNIKVDTAKDRIRLPLDIDRAQYQACLGHITTTALRLVQSNYTSTERPYRPCTGVFKATTGLPYAYKIDDIRALGISLLPSDFHPH